MASNFLIGFPDIPFKATSVGTSATISTSYPSSNLVTGSRGNFCQLAAAQTADWTLDFDLGLGGAGGTNYIYVARADILARNGMNKLWVDGNAAAPGVPAGGVHADTSFGNTLYGPRSEDYIGTWSDTAGFRHWWVTYSTGGGTSTVYAHSKVYLGTFFDMGRDPDYDLTQERRVQQPGNRDAAHIFSISWHDITDAKRGTFISDILSYQDTSPVLLYDGAVLVLNDWRILYAKIIDARIIPEANNHNSVTCTFEEVI